MKKFLRYTLDAMIKVFREYSYLHSVLRDNGRKEMVGVYSKEVERMGSVPPTLACFSSKLLQCIDGCIGIHQTCIVFVEEGVCDFGSPEIWEKEWRGGF